MRNRLLLAMVALLGFLAVAKGQETEQSAEDLGLTEEQLAYILQADSLQKALKWETGTVKIADDKAELKIPAGYRYLGPEQSQYVLEKLWGNLEDKSVLGLVCPDSFSVFGGSWAYVVSFQDLGFVKDDDADDIDYDDLLKELKEEAVESNEERRKLGLQTLELLGWASKPYYDKENKVLYWAKEYKTDDSSAHTLNYDVRLLGRKGVLSLNAIATMDDMKEVKASIPAILAMAKFTEGNQYDDFDPKIDEVAAWTIGGLVAGKVLAKVGFFALLLKFWKVIALAGVAAVAAVKKFFFGEKAKEQKEPEEVTPEEEPNQNS